MKRMLNILVAEPAGSQAIRKQIYHRRRIRLAASEQECMDLAYAGSADVMVIDLEASAFSDPDFITRVRFVSRNAFPIIGISSREKAEGEKWTRSGLSELLFWESLTPYRLDRVMRHWVRFRRMQRRLFDADRRALQWWKNLVDALDEVRHRMERCGDSLDAFLGLLDGGEGEVPELRGKHIAGARQQLAELNHIAADLDVAARTIQLRGLERSQREAQCRRPVIKPEAWLEAGEEEEVGERSIDQPPFVRGSEDQQRRYGT
ncbi:MAG: hypothetical protein KAY32_01635 [Candidatus Eisenbacteria sp.]|nr:hypothetical protein [Candidatus Eisenbacteria bacterium]